MLQVPEGWMGFFTMREPMVEPDGVTDNFRGKTVTLVTELFFVHAAQSAKGQLN